jgi:hypothetical protein
MSNNNGFNVYLGKDKNGKVVYVGTTIQKPSDRWRWHKHNGKDLDFCMFRVCESTEEMLALEKRLIDEFKPKLNKIAHRKQNLNVKLSEAVLFARKGDSEWCQCCLKRRVNKGYSMCLSCERETRTNFRGM